jgi:hypothetical protein
MQNNLSCNFTAQIVVGFSLNIDIDFDCQDNRNLIGKTLLCLVISKI